MKRIIILCLSLILLFACQPTPEEDAVKQKNQDAMIEMARNGEAVTVEIQTAEKDGMEPPKLDYRTMYGIPERLNWELSGLSDKVKITVDAEIRVPDQPMPIVRAVPVDFSQEMVYDLWNRLVGDRKLLIMDEKETKETIKMQIEYCMEILNGSEKNEYEPGEIEQRLEDLKARFIDAPDGEPQKEADGTLITGELRDNRGRVVARRLELQAYDPVDLNRGISFIVQNNYDLRETIRESDGAFCVMKNADFIYEIGEMQGVYTIDYNKPYYSLHVGDPIPVEAAEYVQTTPAEIQKRVDDVLEQMGLTGTFAVSEIGLYPGIDPWTHEPNDCYEYRVSCSRLINGVSTCVKGANVNLYYPEDLMAPEWVYETFAVCLNDSDWIHVEWASPIETQEVIEPNCRLRPFSEIQRIMESRLPMLLERWASDAMVKSCAVNVHRIDLGLWRIREKNTVETGLLVPAYCFYMDILYEEEHGNETWTEKTTDTLIINAVDGTVIDPWNGY